VPANLKEYLEKEPVFKKCREILIEEGVSQDEPEILDEAAKNTLIEACKKAYADLVVKGHTTFK